MWVSIMTVAVYDPEADNFVSFNFITIPYFGCSIICINWVEHPTEYSNELLFTYFSKMYEAQWRSVRNANVVVFGYKDRPNFMDTIPILDWFEEMCEIRGIAVPSIIMSVRNFE